MEIRADTPLGIYVLKVSTTFLIFAVSIYELYGTSSIEEVQAGITGYLCPPITSQEEGCPTWNSSPPHSVWLVVQRTISCLFR